MAILPRSLEVLREREYRLFFFGQAVSLLGGGMVNVALAFGARPHRLGVGSLAFQAIGFAIWGPVAELAGVSTTLWAAFALQLLTVIALLLVPIIRHLRAGPPEIAPMAT